MRLEIFRIETANLLRGLVKYQEKMESQLPLIQESEQEHIRTWADNETVDPADFDAAMDGYYWTYDYFFPRSLRYSFIVLLFLVVENQLNQLCDVVKKRRSLPIRASEISGDAIKRSKIFLQKLAGIQDTNWAVVEDLSKVRNCIVHTLGKVELSRDENRLRQLAAQGTGLSISNNDFGEEGVLLLTAEYCASAVRDVKRFFDEIFDAAGFGPEVSMY